MFGCLQNGKRFGKHCCKLLQTTAAGSLRRSEAEMDQIRPSKEDQVHLQAGVSGFSPNWWRTSLLVVEMCGIL